MTDGSMHAALAPVTLVHGPEELLAERAVRAVVESVRARAGEAAVDVRSAEAGELVPGSLAALLTPSLFDDAAVVVVRGLQDGGEHLASEVGSFLGDPSPNSAVVLVHPGGAKGKRLLEAIRKADGVREVPCAEVRTRRDRMRFLADEVRLHRRKATEEALSTLLDALGSDLRTLAAAIGQLAADTEGLLDQETVLRYYSGRAEVSGFLVADRVLEGRTSEALETLRWCLRNGTDPVPLLAALAAGMRNVAAVASAPRGMSSADLAGWAGMPPWKVDAVRRQTAGWTPEGLSSGFGVLAEADAQVKGAGADPFYAVERAVVTISRLRGT